MRIRVHNCFSWIPSGRILSARSAKNRSDVAVKRRQASVAKERSSGEPEVVAGNSSPFPLKRIRTNELSSEWRLFEDIISALLFSFFILPPTRHTACKRVETKVNEPEDDDDDAADTFRGSALFLFFFSSFGS